MRPPDPQRGGRPVRDERDPKTCPRCGHWCVYDGWGHVHGNGLGIGSCAAESGRPASGATPAEGWIPCCDTPEHSQAIRDQGFHRCSQVSAGGGAGAAQTTTHPFIHGEGTLCWETKGYRYRCGRIADDPIHQTATAADHIAILDGD